MKRRSLQGCRRSAHARANADVLHMRSRQLAPSVLRPTSCSQTRARPFPQRVLGLLAAGRLRAAALRRACRALLRGSALPPRLRARRRDGAAGRKGARPRATRHLLAVAAQRVCDAYRGGSRCACAACPSANLLRATCGLTRGSRATQELLSVIVDVSPTMHGDLPVISAALTEFVHKKVCCAFRCLHVADAPR